MEAEFIPYEQSLALKELGFDEPCILLYRGLDTQPVCQMGYEFKTEKNSDYADKANYWLTVPTFSQAFKFFREKHKLYGTIRYGYNEYADLVYLFPCINGIISGNDSFETQEEAELECLKKLIEIVKEKK